jgi:3-oxoacyl-(acyl-carrier-protein) synthase
MIYLTDYNIVYTTKSELIDDVAYPQRVHWFPDLYKKVNTGLVYVPHKLADMVLTNSLTESLRDRAGKTAFIFASGNAHLAGINAHINKPSRLTYDYKILPLTLTQVYAGRVAQICGADDLVMTDASACASSLKVMTDVFNLITYQNFDRVVVLSFEDAVSDKVLNFFGDSGASLTADKEEQGIKPSAFDRHNGGFYIGQGAVLAVFESDRVATNAQAKLISAGIGSEQSTNAIGQREDGQGFVRAASNAFRNGNVSPGEINVVKTHGTGTNSNNMSEKAALQALFHTPFIATSYKQTIGHTMGASGLLETCLLISDINQGFVPAIKNRTEKDHVFLSYDESIDFKPKILSLAAGMGNIYASAIFDMNV